MHTHDLLDSNATGKASKRGKVFGYTLDTDRRLKTALNAFVASKRAKRYDLSMSLTTTHRDPVAAKRDLKRWADGMRHHFDCHGFYVMEFNDWDFVHYHVWLRFVGEDALTEVPTIADKAKELWALRGHTHPKAFEYSTAWGPVGLTQYLTKSDHQETQWPAKVEQKRLPERLKEHGTGCNWWGRIGSKRAQASDTVVPFIESPPCDAAGTAA